MAPLCGAASMEKGRTHARWQHWHTLHTHTLVSCTYNVSLVSLSLWLSFFLCLSVSRKLSDNVGLLWLLTAQSCANSCAARGAGWTGYQIPSSLRIIWEHVPDTTKRHQFDWFVAKFSLFLIYNQIHWATKLALCACVCALGTKQLTWWKSQVTIFYLSEHKMGLTEI